MSNQEPPLRKPRVARSCQICHTPAIFQCSSCKTQQYCSIECQTGDWNSHRAICVNINTGQLTQPPIEHPRVPQEETEEDIYATMKFYIKKLGLTSEYSLQLMESYFWNWVGIGSRWK
jgi:hypothetical protein